MKRLIVWGINAAYVGLVVAAIYAAGHYLAFGVRMPTIIDVIG